MFKKIAEGDIYCADKDGLVAVGIGVLVAVGSGVTVGTSVGAGFTFTVNSSS